jgi:hypothetical protein
MACLDGACLHSLLCAYDGTQRFIERKVYNLRRVRSKTQYPKTRQGPNPKTALERPGD